MKSSKIENIFNPQDDGKTLSPLTYYQPFQSSFDPEFCVPSLRQTPPHVKRWSRAVGERAVGGLHMSGGGILSPSEQPRSSGKFPGASTSSWGEVEGRSICNSAWRTPQPTCSGYDDRSGAGGLSALGGYQPKAEGFGGLVRPSLGYEGLDGAPFQMGGSVCQSPGRGLGPSTYPLMLSQLGRNVNQNMYRKVPNRPMMCNFCKNNKEVPDIYLNHYLYDPETKVLSCPVLRKHVCEICGGTGDQAHTLQYCPVNRERGLQSKVPVLLKTRTITNSTGKIRRN